nr:hypothetical protein [uncultured Roseobacter sp.]
MDIKIPPLQNFPGCFHHIFAQELLFPATSLVLDRVLKLMQHPFQISRSAEVNASREEDVIVPCDGLTMQGINVFSVGNIGKINLGVVSLGVADKVRWQPLPPAVCAVVKMVFVSFYDWPD